MKKIIENEGIELYKQKNQYYLRYDAGELMIKMKMLKVSVEEAKKVIDDPDYAYDIILAYHDKGIYGEDA